MRKSQQDYNTAVDVLWVFDNSCSMDDNIINVKIFSSFLGSFLSLGLDYQMSSLPDVADNVFKVTSVMNSSQGQQSVINTFTSTLNTVLNTDGSADEKGLQQTHATHLQFEFHADQQWLGVSLFLMRTTVAPISRYQNFINWFQGPSNDPGLLYLQVPFGCQWWFILKPHSEVSHPSNPRLHC